MWTNVGDIQERSFLNPIILPQGPHHSDIFLSINHTPFIPKSGTWPFPLSLLSFIETAYSKRFRALALQNNCFIFHLTPESPQSLCKRIHYRERGGGRIYWILGVEPVHLNARVAPYPLYYCSDLTRSLFIETYLERCEERGRKKYRSREITGFFKVGIRKQRNRETSKNNVCLREKTAWRINLDLLLNKHLLHAEFTCSFLIPFFLFIFLKPRI